MSAGKLTKRERLRTIIEKPYVKLPLILGALLYVGFVVVLLFVAITSLYALGTLFGVSTIQLLTGAVSAGSAESRVRDPAQKPRLMTGG